MPIDSLGPDGYGESMALRTSTPILRNLMPAVLSLLAPICRAQPPDPCQMLTKAEAEQILGEPVRDPVPGSIGGSRFCDFKTVKVYGGILPYSIHIAIAAEPQNVWDAGKKLHAKETRPVPGIGDDAYFLLDELQIHVKQLLVTIGVMKNIDKPDHAKAVEAAERAVAEKSVPRLQ